MNSDQDIRLDALAAEVERLKRETRPGAQERQRQPFGGRPLVVSMPGMNRHQRRAEAAKMVTRSGRVRP